MSLKRIGHIILGFAFVAAVTNFVRRWLMGDELEEIDLTPGPWFAYYMGDFMLAHGTTDITSAIVEGRDGYVWATNTPEWDQYWFEEHGWEFPSRWVTYDSLDGFPLHRIDFGG